MIMTKEQFTEWMEMGLEIEFKSNEINYSICQLVDEKGNGYISFCENYQETLDVYDAETLWNSTYKGMKVSDILSIVPETEIDGLVS